MQLEMSKTNVLLDQALPCAKVCAVLDELGVSRVEGSIHILGSDIHDGLSIELDHHSGEEVPAATQKRFRSAIETRQHMRSLLTAEVELTPTPAVWSRLRCSVNHALPMTWMCFHRAACPPCSLSWMLRFARFC